MEASHAHHAEILAGGSIKLRSSAVHSFLAAKDRVEIVEGKGTLIGGQVIAGKSVEVNVAGSSMNVETVIQVGADFKKLKEVMDRIHAVEKEMAGILKVSSGRGGRGRFVLVREVVHPGVSLIMGDVSLKIVEETPGGRFTLDASSGEIKRRPL